MVKGDITTVKLNKKTKERLEKLRVHKRETYDEILQSMLGILNVCRTDPDRAQSKLHSIDRQVRKNKVDHREKES
jgi:hypothetical protein